jgi:WD40 repeat protein/beta-lactam-binding protein with PASTA domain
MMALSLLLAAAAMADSFSTPLMQYGYGSLIANVAYTPDGTKFLTGTGDGNARLFDADTGALVRTFSGHRSAAYAVAFSPDGTKALTGSSDNTAKLWDVATGAVIHTMTGHSSSVNGVAFSPDGTMVLTASSDSTARLWDVATGAQLRSFTGHKYNLRSAVFSPDGTRVLTGCNDNTAKLWDTATGEQLRTFTVNASPSYINDAVFSPDGTRVLTGSNDKIARLWDAATGEVLRSFTGHTGYVWSVDFSSDGTTAITCSEDNTVRLWNAATGTVIRTLVGHSSTVRSASFSPDGTKLLSGGGGTVKVWDPATGAELRSFAGYAWDLKSVAFSPDGTRILSGGWSKSADLWDTATGELVRTFTGHTKVIRSVAFSPDGTKALTGSEDTQAKLWNTATGELIRTISGHTSHVNAVAFSPDGSRMLTGSADTKAKLWDTATGTLVRTFNGHTGYVNAVAFSPDGATILTGAGVGNSTADYTARLWNAATGAQIRSLSHTSIVNAAVFSSDGARVLTGEGGGQPYPGIPSMNTAKLWDAATGVLIRTFDLKTSSVYGAALSPDGTKVATGTNALTVKLWDTATGALLRSFDNRSQSANPSVAFSADGKRVLSGSGDGAARLWPIEGGFADLTVPDVSGMTLSAAETAIIGAGLTMEAAIEQCGNTVAAGLVVRQHPYMGSMILPGRPVVVVVSTGDLCPVAVPDLAGKTQAAATSALTSAGLVAGDVTQQCSNTVAAGAVISHVPDAYQQILYGSAVAMVVSTGGCPVTVPNVVSQTRTDAGATLTGAGLKAGAITWQCSNTVASGLVIGQNPAADQQAPFGSGVALTVSSGLCNVTVPNVVNQTQADANAAITAANMTAGNVTQQCSNTVAAGKVVNQIPAADERAPFGSAVTLVVSTGLCSVTVPNVVGQAEAAAGTALTGADLTAGNVTQQCSNTVAVGKVIGQVPPAGEQVPFGSAVTLVVSTGLCSVTVPNVVGQAEAAAGTALTGADLVSGTVARQCSNSVAAGLVISQSPSAGAQAPFGTAVALLVSTGVCNVAVPDLVGQTQGGAGTALTRAGLTIGTVALECSASVAADRVISQNPAPGQQAPFGGAVALVVSTGVCSVTVPDVAGQTQTAATAAITGASLTVGAVTQQCSETVAAGAVISQNPEAGAQAPFGSAVALTVSTGACTVEGEGEGEGEPVTDVTVPDVSGMPVEQAQTTLAVAGLSASETEESSDTVPVGQVIRQEPAFGAQVTPGTLVSLVVSSGPDDAGCAGCAGCAGGKGSFTVDKMKKSLGDLFLAGLGLGVLSLLSRRRTP